MKKNKVFVNKIDKKIKNNQVTYDIKENNANYVKEENSLTVRDKIDKLFNRNGYIFNVPVTIITNEKEYHTYIAGIVNDHLVTLDKDIINISDIKNIIIHE